MKLLIDALLALTIGFMLGVWASGPACSHEWYPPECCSGKDCSPAPCEELIEDKDGNVHYMTPRGTKILVAQSHVKQSPDNKCHVCYYRDENRRVEVNGYCAFMQYGN